MWVSSDEFDKNKRLSNGEFSLSMSAFELEH